MCFKASQRLSDGKLSDMEDVQALSPGNIKT